MKNSKLKSKGRIKDLPSALRPREKLITVGSGNLSDAELLAIILGTGRKGQNVLALSDTLLRKYPLRQWGSLSQEQFATIPGIGKSKAARLAAVLELGERMFAPSSFAKVVFNSTEAALAQLREFALKRQEHLVVFYLNARYELLQKEIVGIGSLNSLQITPKEIFSVALKTPCAFILVAHNHPSGDATPSDDDIVFTNRIQEAGEVMGIALLDHVIVSPADYFSFRDNKKGSVL
ncbi:MAG: DNA repair protein RadC [Patescibacteria group bacterium]